MGLNQEYGKGRPGLPLVQNVASGPEIFCANSKPSQSHNRSHFFDYNALAMPVGSKKKIPYRRNRCTPGITNTTGLGEIKILK